MVRTSAIVLLVLSLCVSAACGDDPADIAGDYSASITLRDNGCNLANWQSGSTATQIPVVITQSGADASADVGGLPRIALDLLLGGHVFTGKVDGDAFRLKITGTRPQTSGNCTYTFDATLAGSITGDSLSGRVTYTTATNNNSDCAAIKDCASFQDLAASRPPR